jgi:fructose-1,6-bisphosphatase/inositol monophosphatase family enzyme
MSIAGPHGFPAHLESVRDVANIVFAVGHGLIIAQPAVVAAAKKDQRRGKVWAKRKADGSLVTSSDLWAEAELGRELRRITGATSEIGYVSEEADMQQNLLEAKKPAAWVIDPLDCTGNYTRGGNDWSVTVGFAVVGQPSGGMVYYPARRELYFTGDDGLAYGSTLTPHQTHVLIAPPAKTFAEIERKSARLVLTLAPEQGTLKSLWHPALRQYAELRPAGHTERYWSVLRPEGADIAEHGGNFGAWDVLAPAAIAARAGVIYLERTGLPLDYFAQRPCHGPFELPQKGFIAGNAQTLRHLQLVR